MLKLICPFIAVLVLIVLPLWLIARRAKAGKSVKKPLVANLCGFFLVMFATAAVFLSQGVAAANDGALTENEGSFGKSIVFVGMAEGIAIYGLLIAIVILLF